VLSVHQDVEHGVKFISTIVIRKHKFVASAISSRVSIIVQNFIVQRLNNVSDIMDNQAESVTLLNVRESRVKVF